MLGHAGVSLARGRIASVAHRVGRSLLTLTQALDQVVPPGPDNPIKARWLGIYDGAGIHGTDAVNSIGTNASHGCIRMRIPDVEALYDQVKVGTPVLIV